MHKKKIKRNEQINIKLAEFERDLIIDETFVEQEHVDLLKNVIPKSGYITVSLTLDDLDFILGHIAASANHAEDRDLESLLDDLYDRLTEIESKYELVDE
jgi:hypothetical protein